MERAAAVAGNRVATGVLARPHHERESTTERRRSRVPDHGPGRLSCPARLGRAAQNVRISARFVIVNVWFPFLHWAPCRWGVLGNNGRTGLRPLAEVDLGKDRSALMTSHNQKRMSGFAVRVLVCFALHAQATFAGGPEKETTTLC